MRAPSSAGTSGASHIQSTGSSTAHLRSKRPKSGASGPTAKWPWTAHTFTHRHTFTPHRHALTQMHSDTHTQMHFKTHSDTLTMMQRHTKMHSETQTHTQIDTLKQMQTYTFTHADAL